MISAKKQEHLEAGKRRLEEFRKKKAAERAKKSANHLHAANSNEQNKQPVDYQHEIFTDSNGVVALDGVGKPVLEPSLVVTDDENGAKDFVQHSKVESNDTHPNPAYLHAFSTEIAQAAIENKELDRYDGSWSSRVESARFSFSPHEKNDDYSVSAGDLGRHDYGFPSNQFVAFSPQEVFGSFNQPSLEQLKEGADSKGSDDHVNDLQFASPATTNHVFANVSHEDSTVKPLQNNSRYGSLLGTGFTSSSNEDSVHSSSKMNASFWQNSHDIVEPSNSSISSVGERKLSDYFSNLPSGNSTAFWPAGSQSNAATTGLSSSSYLPVPQATVETSSRRSHPSFLDSIDLSRVEPGKEPEAQYGTNAYDRSTISLVPTVNGNDMHQGVTNSGSMEREIFFNYRKHDEDFAALEQHIEELTQEKFSLQRALDASRTLADSLAAENSSLTDSYNQQGSIVNQLKFDMEMLQEEIEAHLVKLESVKMEYANAQLECTAADERAKLLASEVINLEEKALRLRSSELKLERQLEDSQAELSSFKRKLSNIEKDRQDLQSTVDALREEKKLLQAKLQKTSASGNPFDVGMSRDDRKDVSTSTEDLLHEHETDAAAGTSNLEADDNARALGTGSFPSSLPEDGLFKLEFASSRIPSDQLRMIQNINTIISQLALEKEELMQALLVESSESSKLKELNKELSRKLEIQTQRLELLTAQSMSNENLPIRQQDPSNIMMDNAPYADEGDEVVERVLGWIMKLFPGGPSRRRTRKLI